MKTTCRRKKANAIKLVHNEELDAAEMKIFSLAVTRTDGMWDIRETVRVWEML